jgi:glycosyltransferase involved in cell wall biosynthesis
MQTYSFVLQELITGGAVLSTFELVQALKRLGIDARIVSDYNNKELEDYFGVTVERESGGIAIAVSPKCEGEYSYVRTRDDRWLKHKSKKIAVSKYIADWLISNGENVIITLGNGTHERFYDMGLERDIDVLISGNDESAKNIQGTIERARVQCAGSGTSPLIVWFGRSVSSVPGVESIGSPSLEEIPRLYNRSKCFISASRDEGWGRPVAEAMACGVPKVINENGGNREIEVVSWESIAKSFIKQIC